MVACSVSTTASTSTLRVAGPHRRQLDAGFGQRRRAALRLEHEVARPLRTRRGGRGADGATLRAARRAHRARSSAWRAALEAILDLGQLALEPAALWSVGELQQLERVRERAHAVAVGLLGQVGEQRREADGGRAPRSRCSSSAMASNSSPRPARTARPFVAVVGRDRGRTRARGAARLRAFARDRLGEDRRPRARRCSSSSCCLRPRRSPCE